MNRLPRTTFKIGSFGFIAVGLVHTVTHALELAGGDLQNRFVEMGTIEVSGQLVTSWDLFQGTSILMGLFSIALGLSNLTALRAAGADARPPVGTCLVSITMLAAVVAIGVVFLGPLQVYGGLFGITMFAIPLLPKREVPVDRLALI